jgi:hypothetical protein
MSKNNLNEQIGGFNPCEIFPGSFMHEIITRLKTLETPPPAGGDRLEYIDRVTNTFYECYDILLKYYVDQSFYKQDMPLIYTSDRFIKTSHINYTALIFLSFMVEFHMFILIYKGVNYENGNVFKNMVNYNTPANLNNNQLVNVWESWTTNKDTPADMVRVYKDLAYDPTNNTGIVKTVKRFCKELSDTTRRFIEELIKNLKSKINAKNALLLRNIDDGEIRLNILHNNYEHIYENWREKLLKHIKDNLKKPAISDGNLYQIIYEQINLAIKDTIVVFTYGSTTEYKYAVDGQGMFTWRYLYISLEKNIRTVAMGSPKYHDLRRLQTVYSRVERVGSCITSTLMEHYLYNLLHFKKNSINLGLLNEGNVNAAGNFVGKLHVYWNLTNGSLKEYFSKKENILDYKNAEYTGVSHWYSVIINDLSEFDGHPIILKNTDLRKISGQIYQNYKEISMQENRWLYIRSLIYLSIDQTVGFINKNINHNAPTLVIGEFSQLEGRYLIEKIYDIYHYLETKIKMYENKKNLLSFSRINQYNINNFNNKINLLIDMVLGNGCNKFTLPTSANLKAYIPKKKYNISKFNLTDQVSTNKEIFKNIFTKFVSNEFYKSKESIYYFYKLINNIFSSGINSYIQSKGLPKNSIQFIFKGGNILKLVAATNLNYLPLKSRIPLNKIYKKYFKKSDADFQINIKDLTQEAISPKTPVEMDEIENEITNLSYLLLNRVRNYLLMNSLKFNDFFKLNNEQQNDIFKKLLLTIKKINKLKLEAPFNDPALIFNNLEFNELSVQDNTDVLLVGRMPRERQTEIYGIKDTNRDDFIINKLDDTTAELITIPKIHELHGRDLNIAVPDIQDNLNIYKNTDSTSYFISVNNIVPTFILVRLKVLFLAKYILNDELIKTPFPGEYIDISIPKYTSTKKYFEPNYINKYETELDSENLNANVEFLTLSTNALIDDLEKMIFYKAFPWTVAKYNTRLNRLILFYTFDMYNKKISLHSKNTIINNTIGFIKDIIVQCRRNDVIFGDLIISLNTKIDDYIAHNNMDFRLIKMFSKYFKTNINADPAKTTGIIHTLSQDEANKDINFKNFVKMLSVINSSLLLVEKSFTSDNLYKHDVQSIEYKHSLVPLNAYSEKYLKYKNKYLQLKNKINNNSIHEEKSDIVNSDDSETENNDIYDDYLNDEDLYDDSNISVYGNDS